MGKSYFLKHYQRNLHDCIENLLCNQWGYSNLIVSEEDRELTGLFNGIMDISIFNPDKENVVIGIEIEHISSFLQAQQNITKLKSWTHNSINRKCSMLHIFNEDCKIGHDKIGELVRYARDNQLKNHGFFYDYIFYKVKDKKMNKQTAIDLVYSLDFKTRLWMLIEDCGII